MRSKDESPSTYREFLDSYGNFLTAISEITRVLGPLDETRLSQQTRDVLQHYAHRSGGTGSRQPTGRS
ncbi:hypothetical protein [Nocardiopsis nanhaiensis]